MTRIDSDTVTIDSAGAMPRWTTIIRPRRPWLDVPIGELWHVRDLILLFVRRDFVVVYKQTILGPLWFLLQPLLTTVTFTVIFSRIARLSSDGVPPFLFYLAGTVVWSYFANCLTQTADTFGRNAALFGKVYFPRLAVPVSIVMSNLVTFGLQFVLFAACVVYFWMSGAPVALHATVLLLPLLLAQMAALGLGLGMIVSSLTTRYRDLQQLISFGVQLLMFSTPIIYPLSSVPPRYRVWVEANPMTPVVETFRHAFLGAGTLDAAGILRGVAATLVVLFAGAVLFNRVEQTFMDTI